MFEVEASIPNPDSEAYENTNRAELPTYLDFFAGAGLVRLGLEPTWQCLWANDLATLKQSVYSDNFGLDQFLLKDIATVQLAEIPRPVDMAWASFPCQDLSLAGWQRGMSARHSGTFWAFWRLIRDLFDQGERPHVVVIENVAGLLNSNDFDGLCESLAALDFQFGALVMDARYFLPQSRPRVFVVAVDSRVSTGDLVESSSKNNPWISDRLLQTVDDLPPDLRNLWRWWNIPSAENIQVTPVSDLIETNPLGVEWNAPEETDRLLAMMTDRNRAKIHKAQETEGSSVGFLYKRMRDGTQRAEVRFDGLAGCLRTPSGGSSRQTVLLINEGEVQTRLLSPRESARLMGVPDTFVLPGSSTDAWRAMGDGVAVPVVRWLSSHLLIPLVAASHDHFSDSNCDASRSVREQLEEFRNGSDHRARLWDTETDRTRSIEISGT